MERVLLIGLDGATWDLLKPWIEEGHLPTFKKLMEEGVHGELESTIPPLSIPAWNSLATGKNPGKLGIFSFMSWNRENYQFKPDFLHFKQRCVWDILGEMGKRVIVVNVPCIHRAYKVNGYLVVGFLYTDKDSLTYPKDLRKELDELTGSYDIDVLDTDEIFETIEERFEFIKYLVKKDRTNRYLEKVHATIEKRFKIIEFLLEKKWDFAFVVFVASDRVQHKFWENKEVLLDVYNRLDSKLKRLLTIIDNETTVFIISDHGFGPRRRVFNISEWLLKEGYLRFKTENNSWQMKTNIFLRAFSMLPFAKFLTSLFPLWLQQSLRQRMNFTKLDIFNVDWKLTRVFTQPSEENYGDLYVNFRGKDATGIIDPIRYKEISDEVFQKLKSLWDPTTRKRVSLKVYKKQDIYKGEYLDKSPDLVILPDDNIHGFSSAIGQGKTFMSGKGGEHRIQGIFLAHGPSIKRGIEVKGAKIYDIMPTILHIFNLPIPEDVDGRVLMDIFRGESDSARREIKYAVAGIGRDEKEDEVDSIEEDEIKKRLRELGYI